MTYDTFCHTLKYIIYFDWDLYCWFSLSLIATFFTADTLDILCVNTKCRMPMSSSYNICTLDTG